MFDVFRHVPKLGGSLLKIGSSRGVPERIPRSPHAPFPNSVHSRGAQHTGRTRQLVVSLHEPLAKARQPCNVYERVVICWSMLPSMPSALHLLSTKIGRPKRGDGEGPATEPRAARAAGRRGVDRRGVWTGGAALRH